MARTCFYLFLPLLLQAACQADIPEEATATDERAPEATSLLGTPLYKPEISAERMEKLQADYDAAQAAYQANPNDADNIIWLGRRAGYLWQYQEAVAHFTEGIEKAPG